MLVVLAMYISRYLKRQIEYLTNVGESHKLLRL